MSWGRSNYSRGCYGWTFGHTVDEIDYGRQYPLAIVKTDKLDKSPIDDTVLPNVYDEDKKSGRDFYMVVPGDIYMRSSSLEAEVILSSKDDFVGWLESKTTQGTFYCNELHKHTESNYWGEKGEKKPTGLNMLSIGDLTLSILDPVSEKNLTMADIDEVIAREGEVRISEAFRNKIMDIIYLGDIEKSGDNDKCPPWYCGSTVFAHPKGYVISGGKLYFDKQEADDIFARAKKRKSGKSTGKIRICDMKAVCHRMERSIYHAFGAYRFGSGIYYSHYSHCAKHLQDFCRVYHAIFNNPDVNIIEPKETLGALESIMVKFRKHGFEKIVKSTRGWGTQYEADPKLYSNMVKCRNVLKKRIKLIDKKEKKDGRK